MTSHTKSPCALKPGTPEPGGHSLSPSTPAGSFSSKPLSEWGSMETTMRAELVKAQFGGLTLTRDMAARITGEAHLSQQEDAIAQLYADRMCGVAA